MNRFADLAVGGWKVGAVASLHTGFPITMFSNQYYHVNQRTDRANHYRKLIIRNRSTNDWFGTDPSAVPCPSGVDNGVCAYGEESPTGLGTAAVGTERAPAYHDLDAALSKAFNITESKHLDFRADFFNVLNTTSLAPPSNNVSGGVPTAAVNNLGIITSTVSTERQIQLALKLVF
jgi:hypothetical protein